MAKLLVLSALLVVLTAAIIQAEADGGGQKALRRQKREWLTPPKKLKENTDYTKQEFIAKIRSDMETSTQVLYSLSGAGADKDPVKLFTVNKHTGYVRINGILDREEIPLYLLKGKATYLNGSKAEADIDLRIEVEDENDNDPVFKTEAIGYVDELSAVGTYAINITATDADEKNTLHSQIAYSIYTQDVAGVFMFNIDKASGTIYVKMNTLDREIQDKYVLTIKGTDMNGRSDGRTGYGKVTINIRDVNDNVPTLEKTTFEGSVEENTENVEVIRIQATDKDLEYTDNWLAVYEIISGDEGHYFDIITDNKTNEGILILKKHVDYEQLKEINMYVTVRNKAEYHSSVHITQIQRYPIKIKVINQPEGPRFQPSVKVISISEDSTTISLKKVIATYTAIDSDTLLTMTNVRYVKGEDVDNWLIIDEKTADIRLNKIPDRESRFLKNGTYYAKILCITSEHPVKTATGTIAIQVEDFNDHCPELTTTTQTMCYGDSVVYVTAKDGDNHPNAEPFDFKVLTQSTEEKWNVEPLNGTSVILRSQQMMWPGHYTLKMEIWDLQEKSCGETALHVTVCTCDEAKVCLPKRRVGTGVSFGAFGVLIMLLGLLLLMLIPLLLMFCVCGGAAAATGFKPFPADQTQQLITYRTEGQGEDKNIPLLQIPHTEQEIGVNSGLGMGIKGPGFGIAGAGMDSSMFNNHEEWYLYNNGQNYGHNNGQIYGHNSGQNYGHNYGHSYGHSYGQQIIQDSNLDSLVTVKDHYGLQRMGAFQGIGLSEAFLGSYYAKKVKKMAEQNAASDSLLMYEFEGDHVFDGSLEDICGELSEGDDLAFLNDLGMQFKTLAELCRGSAIDIEISSVTKPATHKPAPTQTYLDLKEEHTLGASHASHASASVSASASASASASTSSTHVTTTDYHQSSSASTAGVLTHNVPGQTLLIQQPAMYYTSAPVYVMEPKPQPTLLVATTPMMGMQENVVLVGQREADLVQGTSTLGLKQTHKNLLVEKIGQPSREAAIFEAGGPQVLLGHSKTGSGSFQIVESGRVQTVEPLHVRQGSSISQNQSIQVMASQNGVAMTQQDLTPLIFPNGATHQNVREERISVVEKSFQSSSAM